MSAFRIPGITAAIVLFGFGYAAADDGELCNTRIEWRAPASCPGKADFVSHLIGELTAAPARLTHIDVHIEESQGQFALSWRISTGPPDWAGRYPSKAQERQLADPSCSVVVRAAATAIALAIDPSFASSNDENHERRLLPGPCPQATDRDIPRALGHRPPSLSGIELFPTHGPKVLGLPFNVAIKLMFGSDQGTLPNRATTLHAGAALQYGRWRLEVSGSRLLEQRTTITRREREMGGDFSLQVAALRGCAEVYRGVFTGSLCVGGQLGRFHGAGFGLSRQLEATEGYRAAGWGVSAARQLQDFVYFRIDAHFWHQLNRPLFTICEVADGSGGSPMCVTPSTPLWQPELITTRVFAGVELVFR